MAGSVGPSSSHAGPVPSGALAATRMRLEEPDHSSSNWYFTREQIERDSPSRHDGIDLKRETYYRKSYCTFLQDLGMRLKVPQVTIATAIVFCHRFFLQQSHVKNDRYTIATACMFLAGKVEETPQSLKNVILMSYEIRNKKDPAAMQKIKQKDVYEQQKELVVLAERVVLATLGFDLNVHHPYKPLVAAIKRFKVAQNALAQVAWNFVNDGLRTSLCLQFKPHHIAAGAIFLAAKFLKVKLPTEGEVVWWQEFDVTPLQLEDVSNQMLELYEQNKPTPGRGSEVAGSSMNNNQNVGSQSAAPSNGASQLAGHSSPPGPGAGTNISVNRINDETNASHGKQKEELAHNDKAVTNNIEEEGARKEFAEFQDRLAEHSNDSQPIENTRSREKAEGGAANLQKLNRSGECRLKREYDAEGKKSWAGLDDLNKDKVKAALEKRRKSRGEGMGARQAKPKDVIDEDDLIERELESGVEAAAQAEKAKQERRESWARSVHRADQADGEVRREYGGDEENGRKRKKSSFDGPSEKRLRTDEIFTEAEHGRNAFDNPNDYAEEGELPEMSPHDQTLSPRSGEKRSVSPMSNRLEKGGSPGRRRDHGIHEQLGNRENSHEVKGRYNNHHYHHSSHHNQPHRDERDRHHYKEREKLDREFKKSRHEYGK